MFNWCAVLVLLPLEVATGYLYHLTGALVKGMKLQGENVKVEMLTALTRPLTELIVQVNREVITDIAMAPNATRESSVLRRWCEVVMTQFNVQVTRYRPLIVDCSKVARDSPFYSSCTQDGDATFTGSGHQAEQFFIGWNETEVVNKTLRRTRCGNLFAQSDLGDRTAGIILLILAITVILSSLFGVVKILNSLLKGPVAKVIQKTVNADLPGRLAYFTGYLALLVGCGLTIVIQSSSVFTSTLTPLVGVGVVSVERMYPMTLGSNLGTTVTGLLAALSTRGGHLDQAMQIALVHLFFNISGVLLFFPVPITRFPIDLAKTLGRVTAKFRWFAGVYLAGMFLVLPGLVFSLSLAGWPWLLGLGGFLLVFVLAVTAVNVIQVKKPQWLPWKLRNWDFLPKFMHSLTPYDYVLSCACVKDKCHRSAGEAHVTSPADEHSEEMRDLLSQPSKTSLGRLHSHNDFEYV
ncbi:sodium-dependent phosphate transport protein 2B [Elysia marginata]|uniref:Sodium-dependent phosphate transport protein 2B n=1 Tax=Elysia marginata TaxID=1093978 RepID=A0AAV4JQX3_9GAST|nr:sodium-dependent phosphate transport protein 2B [Elysia marginata]